MLTALAVIPVLIWIYLLFGRGGFWHVSGPVKTPADLLRAKAVRVVAVIPARNEADVIGEAVASLLN